MPEPHELRELIYLDEDGGQQKATGDSEVYSILTHGVLIMYNNDRLHRMMSFIPWSRVLMLNIRRDDLGARKALDPKFGNGMVMRSREDD